MAKTQWPGADRRKLIGGRMTRLDAPEKVTGAAKYAYDIKRPDMLYAKIFQAAPSSAKILEIDTSEAEKTPGVEAIVVDQDRRGPISEVNYQGMTILAVAATTEEIARDALEKIRIKYDLAEPVMDDRDPSLASGRDQEKEQGDPEAGFKEADVISEGRYGASQITHCCLEAHGQVTDFRDGELYVWPSTQNVSGYAGTVSRPAEVPAEKIHVDCQYMGGGFGSKFAADKWGAIAAKLTKKAGKPVQLMLERDQELRVAGHRPSAFAKVKVGVKNDGTITGWDSD